uniref:Reverse transcriptase domain-containing protein n=1 Tax=Tanacetum cinerariifolium TaxID=118510 RepID=A0A699H6U5_TANCI|nr:hypothetical protein [Tanacetum cinerariifolium]
MDEVCALCCCEDGKLFDNYPKPTHFKDFYNSLQQPQTHSSESFNDNPNFDYTPQEPFVYNQDPVKIFHKVLHKSTNVVVTGVEIRWTVYSVNGVLAAKVSSQYWKPSIFFDDDDEESSIPLRYIISELPLSVAIAPDIPITDSLSMGGEHLSTIPKKESDKVIKSTVEDLVPIPSESKDLFDIEKSDLIESLLNRDTLLVSSPKFESLLEEFSGELAHIDLISPKIVEVDLDPEKEIRLVEKLFDSLMEEIDIFLAPGDSIPSGIENDDYDSEGDAFFLKNYLTMILFPFLKIMIDTLLSFSFENEDKVFNLGIPASKEEKSPHLLSHRGFKASQLISDFSESSMMIYRGNIPILEVSFLQFYPH